MSKLSLDQLKAAFSTEKKSRVYEGGENWNNWYPFWKMEIGEQAVVRFLPDANPENPFGFIVENIYHEFQVNGKKRRLPCLTMYGESCPCCEISQKYYNEKNETMGKRFYKKKEYVGQVVVQSSPFEYEKGDTVNKLIAIGPKIFKLIQAAFASGDLEEAPYEIQGGYDFRINKSKQGDYADYTLSKFAPKQSSLSDDVIASLDLYNLTEQRTKKIDRTAMEAMINANLTGGTYDYRNGTTSDENAEKDDRPVGNGKVMNTLAGINTDEDAPFTPSKPQAKVEDESPALAESSSNKKADDILAQIRARAQAKKQG